MKNFTEITGLGNISLKGLVIEEAADSLLVTARRELYVPGKKVILPDQMTEQEAQMISGIIAGNGGLIV